MKRLISAVVLVIATIGLSFGQESQKTITSNEPSHILSTRYDFATHDINESVGSENSIFICSVDIVIHDNNEGELAADIFQLPANIYIEETYINDAQVLGDKVVYAVSVLCKIPGCYWWSDDYYFTLTCSGEYESANYNN